MHSALPPSLFRHSFTRQAFKQHHLAAYRLFVATNSGQHSGDQNVQAVLQGRTLNVLDPSMSDFANLARSGFFVDKSHAIQDFLQVPTPINLLLRPHHSGKTTLLRMFR